MLDEEDLDFEIIVVDLSYRKRLKSAKRSNTNHERSPRKYSEKGEEQWSICLSKIPPIQASQCKKLVHGVEKIHHMQVWKKKEDNQLRRSRYLIPLC